jgi:hypothetical protein
MRQRRLDGPALTAGLFPYVATLLIESTMAFLPGFWADIFVSYSHVDDEPFGTEETRWVTKFHRHLETRVHAWLGRPITTWRDSKTSGTDVFSAETIDQLRRSAILVSIVTPPTFAQIGANASLKSLSRQILRETFGSVIRAAWSRC